MGPVTACGPLPFSFYRSLKAPAFNGNFNLGIPPNKNTALIGSADIIIHF
ncbi:MAG: hypothetical protein JO283_16385 [Bradyrhizobium sp.]|nr:hypothetical protein [Bradyrhizobium sp.]